MNAEEAYERLIEYFSRYRSLPAAYLENLIKEKTKEGLSREEAIAEIYREVFGVYPEVTAETVEKPVESFVSRKIGFSSLYGYGLENYVAFMGISASYLLNMLSTVLSDALVLLLLLSLATNVAWTDTLNKITLFLLATIPVSVGYAFYASMVFPYSASLLTEGKASIEEAYRQGSSNISRLIIAQLSIRLLAGLPLLLIESPQSCVGACLCSVSSLYLFFIPLIIMIISLIADVVSAYWSLAIVFEKGSLVDSLKTGLRRAVAKPLVALGYLLSLILPRLLLSWLILLLFFLKTPALTGISFLTLAFLRPISDLSLTGVYIQDRGASVKRVKAVYGVDKVLLVKIRRGLRTAGALWTAENIGYVGAATALFAASLAVGYLAGAGPLASIIQGSVSRDREWILNPYSPTASVGIFLTNLSVTSTAAVSGLLTLAGPLILTVFQGVFIGLSASMTDPARFIINVLPHGVIEIPCLLTALGAGLRLAYTYLRRPEKTPEILKESIYVALGLTPVLLAAALIEAHVTPWVVNTVVG